MPATINNLPTSDTYTDPLTATFVRGRGGFALNVANASVYYTLAYINPGDREVSWLATESFLTPVFATFRDVTHEGLPPGSMFGGIKLRSGAVGIPAQVTVM